MKYSVLPSVVMIGPSVVNAILGKSVSLGKCFLSWLMWNVGNIFEDGGSRSWYEDDSGYAFVILKGPSKRGMNLATLPSLACM